MRSSVFTILVVASLSFLVGNAPLAGDFDDAGSTRPEPNWDRDLALKAAAQVDTGTEADRNPPVKPRFIASPIACVN